MRAQPPLPMPSLPTLPTLPTLPALVRPKLVVPKPHVHPERREYAVEICKVALQHELAELRAERRCVVAADRHAGVERLAAVCVRERGGGGGGGRGGGRGGGGVVGGCVGGGGGGGVVGY